MVGNPPFGYQAWLALAFLNHAAMFADYIDFVLPMAFQSDSNGSPKHRVVGPELVYSTVLPSDAFTSEDGRTVSINALWQVWRRGVNNRRPVPTCNQWADVFTIDLRAERIGGQHRIGEADWYLQAAPSTTIRRCSFRTSPRWRTAAAMASKSSSSRMRPQLVCRRSTGAATRTSLPTTADTSASITSDGRSPTTASWTSDQHGG